MRNFARARRWFRRQAVLAGLILLGVAGPAAAAEMFRVEGVAVDVTAESAVAARQQALEQGQREALAQLLRRLTSPDDHARLPRVADLPVEPYVASFDIADERVAPTQYVAKLNVTFLPEEVRGLLRSANLPFVERRSEPMLVVPVALEPEGPSAWVEASPWRAAWYEAAEDATITVLALPLGDLADVAAAPPEAVVAGDEAALSALASRYGTKAVYVTTAAVERAPDTQAPLRVETVTRRADRRSEPVLSATFDALPDESEADLLERAAARVVYAIENDWKREQLVPLDRMASLPVTVRLADLAGWVQIRRELVDLPEIRAVAVDAFARNEAQLTLGYAGELDQLMAAVERIGLTLVQEGDGWQLRRAGDPTTIYAPNPGAPAPR